MKFTSSLSLRIGIANPLIVALCIALFMAPVGARSGPMSVVFIVPLFYCMLSPILAVTGIVIGLIGVFKKEAKTKPTIGLGLNTAYLVLFLAAVASMWEAWMSV